MPIYYYKAKDNTGKAITGRLAAANEAAVTAHLEDLGYVPLSVRKSGYEKFAFLKPGLKVRQDHLVTFTRQFATIVKAGVPILMGLDTLAQQTESPALKAVLKKIAEDVKEGASLSQAIEKYPTIFSDFYVNTVVAGETGGVLDKVLVRLASTLEDNFNTTTNVKTAMRYPAMVVVALVAASFVLVIFVIPNFADLYSRFNVTLPLPTRVLVLANLIIRKWWYVFFPIVGVFWFLLSRYINTPAGRLQWDSLKLKVPIIKSLTIKLSMLRFAIMFDTLNESGLPIMKTLEIVSSTIGNVVLGKEVESMRQGIADGKGISASLVKSNVFPPLVSNMLAIGEKTGSLSEMLNAIADYYDIEIKAAVKNLTTMIEPVITLVLGVMVLFMALAIFLPLWDMINVFRSAGAG